MTKDEAYQDFIKRFKLLIAKNPLLVKTTLSNIFTMRLIGNKTHGDLAEIAIVEFINQYMYDFKSKHVGKDLYRAKEHEEDIEVLSELTKIAFPISLKAYGDGPLQLSTDKNSKLFPYLSKFGKVISSSKELKEIFQSEALSEFGNINVMPLIYREKEKQCNIMLFDHSLAIRNTARIQKESAGKGRIHPVYRFFDKEDQYICEVRYGGGTANALQRGLWTNTKNATNYFDSATNGWIDYSDNPVLVRLFSLALVASEKGHEAAQVILQKDIDSLKKQSGL